MNVFIPHRKDFNIYFDEIIKYSTFNYIFGGIEDYKPNYEIVNIQFPEAIFNWNLPSQDQLDDLEEKMIHWKKKSRIVLILNDHKSHYDNNNEFDNLFKLIHKYADGVIHLGNFSLNKFKFLFGNECQHKLIYHPLYESLLNNNETADFQNKFKVDLKNKYVVSVIGNIRSIEEVKLVLKIFKKIPFKNKILIVPKMFNIFKNPNYFPYRFRKIYKIIIEKLYCFPLKKNQYFFGYTYIDCSLMVDLLEKTSLMIIPRLRNLNSGVLFLGLTFDKPMVIPKVGNLIEIAEYFNLPLLDLEKGNFKQVLSKITDKEMNQIFLSTEYLKKKEQFYPQKISNDYESFFNALTKI